MDATAHGFNLTLGALAFGYSWLPPHRVRGYRRGIALFLRWLGLCLMFVSASSLLLAVFRGR